MIIRGEDIQWFFNLRTEQIMEIIVLTFFGVLWCLMGFIVIASIYKVTKVGLRIRTTRQEILDMSDTMKSSFFIKLALFGVFYFGITFLFIRQEKTVILVKNGLFCWSIYLCYRAIKWTLVKLFTKPGLKDGEVSQAYQEIIGGAPPQTLPGEEEEEEAERKPKMNGKAKKE